MNFTSVMDSEGGASRRKVMNKPKNVELDEAVYVFFKTEVRESPCQAHLYVRKP